MSSTSDFTPLPFTVPRPRSSGQTHPQARRLMTVEWHKLFAEATEKDMKEGVNVEADDLVYSECESGSNESDWEENEGNDVSGENSEVPLNLCYKSKTLPNMTTKFENADHRLDLSAEKQPLGNRTSESVKQISCTVPNFQSNNYQEFLLTKKNICDINKTASKLPSDKREDNENIDINLSNRGICTSGHNWTPMKEVNILDVNLKSERKKKVANDELQLEKSLKEHSNTKPSLDGFNKSDSVDDNVKKSEKKEVKVINRDTSHDQPDGKEEKQKGENSQAKADVRFAVPAVPEKGHSGGKKIVVNGNSYQILAPLGKGGSSSVYLVLNTKNELLAVKCVKLSGVAESIKNDYLNEIQHLMRMQHSTHVIKLYDHQYVAKHKLLYAVMEKGDTDLSHFLKDKAASKEGITPELIMYYWNEMLLAVKSIHDNNIIHRDLKPANFLLVSGRLKLIDFGIASSIQNEQTSILMDTQSGTFNYMSPEALLDLGSGNEVVLKIGRKSDVWSLGCILYYFLYKKTPYQDLAKPLQKMKAITDPTYAVDFPKLPGVPDILIESCKRCLIHDRKKRASIEELLELKSKPLLSLSQVLGKLKTSLSEEEYRKAEKALSEEIEQ